MKSENIETQCKVCKTKVFISKTRAQWGGLKNSYCKTCAIKKANKGFIFE